MSIVPNVYDPPPVGFPQWMADLEDFRRDLKPAGTNGIFGADFYSLSNYSDHTVVRLVEQLQTMS